MEKRAITVTVTTRSTSTLSVACSLMVEGRQVERKTYAVSNVEGRQLGLTELAALTETVRRWTRDWAAQLPLF